jgi:hypothetical protein
MSQALERLRLKWLAIGALLVMGAVRSKRQGRPVFGDVRPVARQYGQLAGKDPDVARAEMLRIVKQLLPLDARTRRAGELPRPVTRAEFELAADALLRFYVSGRHTDDVLLRGDRGSLRRGRRGLGGDAGSDAWRGWIGLGPAQAGQGATCRGEPSLCGGVAALVGSPSRSVQLTADARLCRGGDPGRADVERCAHGHELGRRVPALRSAEILRRWRRSGRCAMDRC